jgi:hypothetical protein
LVTTTDIGVALVDEIPAPVGAAVAVSVTAPLVDGRQVQLTTILGDEPLVNLFLHPGIITFLALKVTLDAADTFALIVTAVRYVAAPLSAKELKVEVSTTSVTVTVTVSYPAFEAASTALKTTT